MKEVVREVSDPQAVLEEVRNNGWNAWLVLDPGCHPDALAKLYALEPNAEKTLLFFDSCLEHMHELSPRFAPVTPDSLILDWLEEHDPRGWGMVVASDATSEEILAHLRSLLVVKTEGDNLIFRVWDGRILARICAAMPEETPLLLGPARLVLTRTSAGAWVRIDHTPEDPDTPRPVHPCPWYMFGACHAEVFREGRAQVLARNIVFELYGDNPQTHLPLPPEDESLLDFAIRHVVRGLALGLGSQEALDLFVRCSLFHGESFPDVRAMPVLKPFASQIMNEAGAVAAMRKLCAQGE
jgi:hypothetical protein